MNHSQQLTKLSSSQMIGGGLGLGAISTVIFVLALSASMSEDAGDGSAIFMVISGAASLAGWIMLAVGVTRLAAKADDIHRLYVERNTQPATSTTTVSRQEAASAVDRFLSEA